MPELKKIRVREARPRDLGLFRKLWGEFLQDQQDKGSIIRSDSDKNLEVYSNLFRIYTDPKLPEQVKREGTVLFIGEIAVLMAGDAGNEIEVTVGKRPALIWGAYLASDQRGKGIGNKLFEEAFGKLRKLGFDSVFGNVTSVDDGAKKMFEKFSGSSTLTPWSSVYVKLGEKSEDLVKDEQE